MFRQPNPTIRLFACGTALFAGCIAKGAVTLGVLFAILLGLLLIAGLHRQFATFLVVITIPLGTLLFLVWGVVMGAPPGHPLGSDRIAGMLYALTIILRLMVLSGIFQLTFLSTTPDQLAAILAKAGVKEDTVIAVLASFALAPELRLRAKQVVVARYARGLVHERNLLARFKQLPYVLSPLFAWTLRSAVQRAEHWEQRNIVRNAFAPSGDAQLSWVSSLFFLGLSLLAVFLAVLSRGLLTWS